MKRWFRVILVTVFALSAVGLVVLQLTQTRRTFTISDNMFSIGVSNAMEEVVRELGDVPFSYQELDSLVSEELLVNGIDLHPAIGLYDGLQDAFLYSTAPAREAQLRESPYRYSFQPVAVATGGPYFVILSFSDTTLLFQRHTDLYVYVSLFLILIIAVLFIISLRTIANQRRLDQMKTEFVNNMTHEVKTPISTIALACEMLSDPEVSQDDEQRRSFVAIVADENKRMRLLVETILQSAKMANKRFSLTLREVDLHQVVQSVVQSFRLAVSGRGGEMLTDLRAVPPTLAADELHLTNLVFNLVDNAIKYSNGTPYIEVSTEGDERSVTLRVTDHGIGISREDQRHIFEKFYRVSTGNVHNVKGFGIGLSYVAEVVRLHRGHISVESEPGKGSTFIVTLPR